MEYDIRIDNVGTVYYKKGTTIIHREDGPALITPKGSLHWIVNNISHRIDGPAKIYYNGDKAWYISGERLSLEKETILNKWWDNKNGI